MSINSVTISGNLGRDPEVKQTATGTDVATFSMCVNDRRKNQQTGEWEDVPNWVEVTFFGNRASTIGRFLAKGSHVTVTGKLRESKWERDGQKRSKLSVLGSDIDFGPRAEGSQPRESSGAYGTGAYYDEDIPF